VVVARARRFVLLACAATALAAPAPAAAHLRSGTVAVDYDATVSQPAPAAFTARIYQSDRAVGLTVRPGHVVLVKGYLGEPMLRLSGSGVGVNAASPTAAGAGLFPGSARAVAARPVWHVRPGRTAVWHDRRTAGLPAGVARGGWRIPLVVDGRRLVLTGTLVRLPRPAIWPWSIVLALCLGAGVLLPLRLGTTAVRRAALVAAVVASAAAAEVAIAFALDPYASPGTWIAGIDELALLAAGLAVLVWAPRQAHVPAAVGIGLLAVAVGLSKGAAFLHAAALSLAAGATRPMLAIAIGAGCAAAISGWLAYVRASERTDPVEMPPLLGTLRTDPTRPQARYRPAVRGSGSARSREGAGGPPSGRAEDHRRFRR